MSKTLIFGHKSPDTDTITSAVAMANLKTKLGEDVEAVRLGHLNKETKYIFEKFGVEVPRYIENLDGVENVILVDHNEFSQSANGIENVTIKMVVDHHRIANIETAEPLYYRAEPVGCTATVINKLYKENNINIDPKIASLMLSAIISDTLLFKSPTCTKEDVETAKELAKIANIDIDSYGLEMLKAGTDLSDVTADGLIKIDSKEFEMGTVKSEVAQISVASIEDMMQRKNEIEEAMNKVINEKSLDLFLVVITDIINSNSKAIALGNRVDIVEKAFNITLENNTIFLPGVVSRKKQVIPNLMKNA